MLTLCIVKLANIMASVPGVSNLVQPTLLQRHIIEFSKMERFVITVFYYDA